MNHPIISLSQLSGVRTSGPRHLMARCPFHSDRRPSFSISLPSGYARCFACKARTRVSFDVDHQQVARRAAESRIPAGDETSQCVEQVLEQSVPVGSDTHAREFLLSRRIDVEAVEQLGIRLLSRFGAPWLVFPYFDQVGTPLYCKLRSLNGKRFLRVPAGTESVLFNLLDLENLRDDESPIIVEGELDVAAIRTAGGSGAVSVPNGAGTRVSAALLSPLFRFDRVVIWTDADAPGEELESRLTAWLPAAVPFRQFLRGGCS